MKCPESEGEVGISEAHFRRKEGHMTNIYLTDSDEEAIANFDKDHEELRNKTIEHVKDKVRKDCLKKGSRIQCHLSPQYFTGIDGHG